MDKKVIIFVRPQYIIMGLDIFVITDNYEEIRNSDYYSMSKDYRDQHKLSRTFCNLMCRQNVVDGEPELEQIGRITGVNISALYDMEKYWSDETIDFALESAQTDVERQEILNEAETNRSSLKNNIDLILRTIGALVEKLSMIDNLDKKLDDSGFDSLDYSFYFTEFNVDKGKGYIGNNFGQDLRNFKRFLEFAKSRGATTVWFTYG